jgi:hypothetical protein
MMNNVAYNELRQHREGVPSDVLVRDRELLDGFWETYPGGVAEESLLTAQRSKRCSKPNTGRTVCGNARPRPLTLTSLASSSAQP